MLAEQGDEEAVLDLRREHHRRMPSASTYSQLQEAARSVDAWPFEQASAREILADGDTGGLVDALLADGDVDSAWDTATVGDVSDLDDQRWARLAEAREPSDPAGALGAYLRLVESTLRTADKRAYRAATNQLKRARRAADAAGLSEEFDEHLAGLREQHRRRPTLIAMLDKAGLQ